MSGPRAEAKEPLVIVGDSAFAEIAHQYFTYDSDFRVVAFCVERAFLTKTSLAGLPVVPFEELESHYDPAKHHVYAAITYQQVNRLRARLAAQAKAKGFRLASYVSSRAFVWRNVALGEHCFIFENCVLQPFVTLADNIVIWSGGHVAHHSTIRSNCFLAPQVAVSGFVDVGENCFLGINSTVANNITLGRDCWVGPAVTVKRNLPAGSLLKGATGTLAEISSYQFFEVEPTR